MSDQIREQLSALMDGELPGDQTRFLLRRIDADPELAQCWSRYQAAAAVLRREAISVTPDNRFAAAVMGGLTQAGANRAVHGMSRALRWVGGGAIAAAVAVVALVATRPQDMARPAPNMSVASAPATTPVPVMSMPAQSPIDLRAPIMTPLPAMNADYAQPASYDSLLPLSPYSNFGKTPMQRFAPYLLTRPMTNPVQHATATQVQATSPN